MNQLRIATKNTATLQRRSQMMCGMERRSRKKTVRRDRSRSSSTTILIGCGFIGG
jgi:hypothetical protein